VDSDGRLVAKVDDLEIERTDSGDLVVTAILIGPRALGPRLGGRLGRWVTSIAGRLSDQPIPRIDVAHVLDVGSAITVSLSTDEITALTPLEMWVDRQVIARIPGSRDAS
ncbi:MAG: hypothetical protein M3140_01915, partial [Actinomycetota bacterium]|nr:hypothetical protein [Actinomycetota bacterium]